ncbi:hypothetical protein HDV06_003397 [Boothiomyces sp. JEL0866]|nr:hypothetical protein HDV06_003349 [Boothiomyces sp. JEL0866]KAJ3325627.1 hypothetical protein HDV06_003397 [Boothiomyces sp. JEL0866]
MFYSETILNKKGPLAKVWLAAHWERKLSKSQFLATNIPNSISAIEDYDHMALRLSGQLLLGVCKIFSRKAKYLFEDCNEALVKIKMAFRPSVVDLNVVQSVVSNNQITLADTINEFDIMYNPVLDLNSLKPVEDNTFLSFTQDSMEVGRDADTTREFVPQNSFQKSLLDPEISMEVPREEIQMDFGDQGALDFGFDLEKEPEVEGMQVEPQMPDMNMDLGLDLDRDATRDATMAPEQVVFEPENLELDISMEKRKTPKRKRIAIDTAIFMDESYYRAMVKGDFSVPKKNEEDNPLLKLIMNYPTLSTFKHQFELEEMLDLSLDDMLELQYRKFPKLDLKFLEPKKLEITYQPEETMASIHIEEPVFEPEVGYEPEISFDAGVEMNFGDISVIQPEEQSPAKPAREEESLLDIIPPHNVSIFEFDEEESIEETEKLTSNTQKALNIIKDKFNGEATFSQITENESKSIAAKVFFELLVLKTKDMIAVKQAEPYAMSEFVQRRDGQLILNNSIFRFASFNTPNLHILEDPWQRISPYEQKDQIAAVSQLGGQVVRTYVFSIPTNESELKHLKIISGFGTRDCKWELDEQLMHDFDFAIHLANQYNIKVIIPFIDNWEWFGGIESFSNLYGIHKSEFFSNTVIRAGFKHLISGVLNRNNSFSGILYKDDPAILCWETGNEIEPPPEWTLDIAKFIKELDQNHLVMDSSNGIWTEDTLQSDFIDIFTNHYYPQDSSEISLMNNQFYSKFLFFCVAVYSVIGISLIFSHAKSTFYPRIRRKKYRHMMLVVYIFALFCSFWFANADLGGVSALTLDHRFSFRLNNDIDTIKPYKKVFVVGEFGLDSFEAIRDFQDAFMNRIHNENSEYSAYHYPGFPSADGFNKDELLVINSMVEMNRKLGVKRNLTIPDPPVLFIPQIVENEAGLRWKGATGAAYYSIKVEASIIISHIRDNVRSGSVMYYLNLRKFKLPISVSVVGVGEWGQIESNRISINL